MEEARQEEDLSRSLAQIRRESARKDAAIKSLRSQLSEASESREEKSSELLEATVAATVAATRTKHARVKAELKAELVQRDKELHHAESKMQLLKARAAGEEQMAAAAAASSHASLQRKSLVPSLASLADEPETPQASEDVSTLPQESLEQLDGSLRSSGIGALEQELSGVLLRAANSIESSWEQSAVRESLEILNLQMDDLPAFLSDASSALLRQKIGHCVLIIFHYCSFRLNSAYIADLFPSINTFMCIPSVCVCVQAVGACTVSAMEHGHDSHCQGPDTSKREEEEDQEEREA